MLINYSNATGIDRHSDSVEPCDVDLQHFGSKISPKVGASGHHAYQIWLSWVQSFFIYLAERHIRIFNVVSCCWVWDNLSV